MPKIIHPKQASFSPNGKLLAHGAYNDIIQNTSTAQWDKLGGLFKLRRTARKAWIFLGAYTEDLMVGLAIADAGFIGNAFAYFYVPSEDLYVEEKVLQPLGFANDFNPELKDKWQLKKFSIETIGQIMHAKCGGKFEMNLEIEHSNNGLSFICPTVDRPFNFTYKNLCRPTKANVKYKGKTYSLDGKFGGIDYSKGYPPRHTTWNWAMISGATKTGVPVGMNLFRGHNDKYENAAWIGDEQLLFSNTTFIYDKKKPLDQQVWQLQTEDGLVDLTFTPSKARREKVSVGVLSHDFTQPFGKFEGSIQHKGKTHEIIGYGPVEEHESLW